MPNWCANTLTVEHSDPAMIDKFQSAVEECNLLQTFVPLDQWDFEEAVDKWGTKWDISNGEVIDRWSPETLCVSFDTAWSQPSGFYDELMEQGFTVSAQFFEPGVGFVGQYVDGEEVVYEIDPDDLTNIPGYLNEQWGITEMFEDWDEE